MAVAKLSLSDSDEAFREAETRIAAWEPGAPLDLAIGGLERIPDSIRRLTGLTELVLTRWDGEGRRIIGAREVSDLSPLSGLSALTSLDCSVTEVSDLDPLSGLTALTSLDCSFTQVSDLDPLSGLSGLTSLNCLNTQVSDLDPLSGLTALTSLDCSVTKVSDLDPLSGLTALTNLKCSFTKVSDLGPLSHLSGFTSLDCSDTKVSDLSPLSGLTALTSLDCSGTKVSDLGPLSRLSGINSLDCSDTEVSDLGPLSGLTALTSLDCSGTKVSDLGPLSRLSGLNSLDCSDTEVSDLGPLSGLTALTSLDCSFCQITQVPEGLFDVPKLEKVFCYESRLGDIPAEVLSQEWDENCLPRLRAHLRDLEHGAEPIRDAKLLVLGNGRVGKTQLCHRLQSEAFEADANSTHGIVVQWFDLDRGEGGASPRIQLWDFGGQDIYHSTHTLFLRSRGIYLVAWSPAQEDNDTHTSGGQIFRNYRLPYWLSQVEEFGGRSAPLIVVQTQADRLADRRKVDAAAEAVAERFTTKFEIHHSARTKLGHGDLIAAIAESFDTIPQPKIGAVRARVKRVLEDRITARAKRTMTIEAFRALCETEGGVADPDLFLETLHNAGTVFHRAGFFNDEIILDQEWAIRAIYAVLDRTSHTYAIISSQGGSFTRTLLGLVLWDKDYTAAEQALFLSMMRSCGICFVTRPADPAHGLEALYIAPDLLPERRTDAGWDGESAEYGQERHYPHLPGSLIRSIICAIGQRAGAQGEYWRGGVWINETRTRSEGLIASDAGTHRLILRTRNGAASDLLATLIQIVEQEESRLGLKPITVDGTPEARPRQTDKAPDQPHDPVQALDVKLPPRAAPEWFVSYATEDERTHKEPVTRFCDAVKAVKGITVRRDVNELHYGDAIEAFMRQLAAGERIFVWLTDAYLTSPYCMFELHEIWRRCVGDEQAFEQRVTVVLGDVSIRYETDLRKYRDFWREQQDAAFDRLKNAQDPFHVAPDLARITEIVNASDNILIFIRGRVRYASFDELMTDEGLTS